MALRLSGLHAMPQNSIAMGTTDNVKMEINIAGERIFLTVPFSQQDAVRETEKNVESLYSAWRKDFPRKSDKELLAMIAYQYASYYDHLINRIEQAKEMAKEADRKLSELL